MGRMEEKGRGGDVPLLTLEAVGGGRGGRELSSPATIFFGRKQAS